MKTPRDLSGAELAKALRKLGYTVTRQTGSHLRITTQEGGEHHEVIPNHSRNVATHHHLTVPELLVRLEF